MKFLQKNHESMRNHQIEATYSKGQIFYWREGFSMHYGIYLGEGESLVFRRRKLMYKRLNFQKYSYKTIGFFEEEMPREIISYAERQKLLKEWNYKYFSKEDALKRAQKAKEYEMNLLFDNEAHFVLWCKVGLEDGKSANQIIKKIICQT